MIVYLVRAGNEEWIRKRKIEVKCMEQEMNMTVSPVCARDGQKYAYVAFTDGNRSAEGRIPECRIMSSTGFTAAEVEQLEAYMKRELTKLKKMAAGIRIIDALMK